MLWFKVVNKPYLLSVKVRTKKLCQERQRRMPQLRRSKQDAAIGSLLTSTQQMPSLSTTHPNGAEGGDKDDGGDKDEHEGRSEDKEDEDNGDDQMEGLTPQVVHRNLARSH
ncbi:hypothetical protein Golob_023258 [Gossypium lobatum]|uniref:Uncharacterized protein n=1 Tax=Gossypium lobatum TaxID=34289 RepID=A0A7J8LJ26_9ROSI|nr:hypothetical protein [Gossypium lobatum]